MEIEVGGWRVELLLFRPFKFAPLQMSRSAGVRRDGGGVVKSMLGDDLFTHLEMPI